MIKAEKGNVNICGSILECGADLCTIFSALCGNDNGKEMLIGALTAMFDENSPPTKEVKDTFKACIVLAMNTVQKMKGEAND